MFPKRIKRMINEPIPDNVIQERDAGRGNKLSYISGAFVIDMLNNAFDYQWDWECEKEWVQESIPKFNPKYDKEPMPQPPVAHVRGKLTVYFEQDDGTLRKVIKNGHGSKVIIGGASEQESVFKAADTDALKKAASKLGIGLELYRSEDEQEHADDLGNIWSDEELNYYKEDREKLIKVKEENGLEEEDLDLLAYRYSNGDCLVLMEISPSDFTSFVNFVEKQYQGEKKTIAKKSTAKEAS